MRLIYKGNVHEVYELTDKVLIIVRTDRISVHGRLLPMEIKNKGIILNKISDFWFNHTISIINNHVISFNIEDIPSFFHSEKFKDRIVMVEKLNIIPFEFIVRGYIYGRMWKAYQKNEMFCGMKIEGAYKLAQKLDEPIITPTTKSDKVGDVNVTMDDVEICIGKDLTQQIISISYRLYKECSEYAISKGLIIADTKFEFGLNAKNQLLLADEICTPDTSRFWDASDYETGKIPKSYDKQLIRDWLTTNIENGEFQYDRIPESIIRETEYNYRECMHKLLGIL